jgi:hypothetical protein
MIKVAGREAVMACENGKVHVMLFIYSKGRAVLGVSLMNLRVYEGAVRGSK